MAQAPPRPLGSGDCLREILKFEVFPLGSGSDPRGMLKFEMSTPLGPSWLRPWLTTEKPAGKINIWLLDCQIPHVCAQSAALTGQLVFTCNYKQSKI